MGKSTKKTQAERVATENKKNKSTAKSAKSGDKGANVGEEKTKIPVRFITSSIFIALFTILLIAGFSDDGIFLNFFKRFFCIIFCRNGKIKFN